MPIQMVIEKPVTSSMFQIPTMSDEVLHKQGEYFTHHDILNRYGISFGVFLEMNHNGSWATFIRMKQEERRRIKNEG